MYGRTYQDYLEDPYQSQFDNEEEYRPHMEATCWERKERRTALSYYIRRVHAKRGKK